MKIKLKSEKVNGNQNPARDHETVGRNYERVRYGVHSRRVGGDGNWYGGNTYNSFEDAMAHLRKMGKPLDVGGGFIISFPAGKDLFEYRIVRVEMNCTVEHVEDQLV